MPLARVQANASTRLLPDVVELLPPTITTPSADTALARLSKRPPARSPSASIPSSSVQRNASRPFAPELAELASPTTTVPSSEMP